MQNSSVSNDVSRPHKLNGNGQVANDAAAPPTPHRETSLSVIGADIVVTGNIEAEVDLQIEGRIVGDVRCSTLILGERSAVNGSIFAQRVRVSGVIEGSVETIDLAIEFGARVKGDVTYSRLRIANGGVVEGSMIHRPLSEEQAAELNRPKLVEGAAEPAPPPKVHYIE